MGDCKALMEAGLRPDAVAGASAGVWHGLCLGMSPGWSRQCFILGLRSEYLNLDCSSLLALCPSC